MQKIIVDAEKSRFSLGLKELFRYKDLFFTLAYRDYRVRYAQTFLGFLWAFIQPLITLLIFVIVFGRAIQVETAGIPYPLFALSGMVAWTYFAYVLNESGNSIIGAQEMVKKIYFPRLIIPLSKAAVGFVDFGIALLFLLGMLVYYQFVPPVQVVAVPVFFLFTVLAALAVGVWLSALTIRYRDFKHIIPFMVQIGLYATPIAYPVEMVPKEYLLWYHLNPMAGVVEGFRWSILGIPFPPEMYLSFAVIALLFISALLYFRKVEKVIADIV